MKLFVAVLMLALLAFTAAPAVAKTLPHEAAGIEITYPDTWKDAVDGETLTVTAPDDNLALMFFMLPEGGTDKMGDQIDKALEKELGAITWEKEDGTEEKLNGMDIYYWVGTAKEGKYVVLAWVVYTPSGKELLCYMAAETEKMDKHKAAVEAIMDSIKPLAKKTDVKAAEPKADEKKAEPAADEKKTEEGGE